MNLPTKDFLNNIKPYQATKDNLAYRMDANENPYDLMEYLLEDFIEKIRGVAINRYPDTDCEELRKLLGIHNNTNRENIICGNGSDEIIQIIINTFVGFGDAVITHTPTFSMYKVFTTIAGGNNIEVPSDEEFNVNIQKIISAANANQAKIIFICNPNNPTGFCFSRNQIINIIEQTNAIVVVDEAYSEFMDDSVVDLATVYEKLIVLKTMSKAFALAGARIGYGISNKETIERLNRVKPPYNLNTFSQLLGMTYLENLSAITESIVKIKDQREYLLHQLSVYEEIRTYPSKSNFILIKTDKASKLLQESNEAGIALRYFANESLLENCIRITVGSEEENNRLINVIKKVVG